MERTIPCIMLIDDDIATTVYNEIIIEDVECVKKVISMNSAEEALTYLNSTGNEESIQPNLILLDINMPTMDGWEFLNEFLKIKNNLNKKITLYVVSSSIDPRDLERVKSFNMVTDYLIKPIELKKFEKIFDKTAA